VPALGPGPDGRWGGRRVRRCLHRSDEMSCHDSGLPAG
jgi:hypothetical protein